jgi:hypothetical protein
MTKVRILIFRTTAAATLGSFLLLQQSDEDKEQPGAPILKEWLQRLRGALHEGSDGNWQALEGFDHSRRPVAECRQLFFRQAPCRNLVRKCVAGPLALGRTSIPPTIRSFRSRDS